MTETILKALMRLFATVSLLIDDTKSEALKEIVESYLKQLVNSEKVRHYFNIYIFYIQEFKQRSQKRSKLKDSLFTVKSIIICEQINAVLLQKQKALFLVQLLDMLKLSDCISEREFDYLKAMAMALNFSADVYKNLLSFIYENREDSLQGSKLTIGSENQPDESIRYMKREGLQGKIQFLYIPEINIYFFRHTHPDQQLYMNGRAISPFRTYILEKGSAIHNPFFVTIHYSDVVQAFMGPSIRHKLTLTARNLEFRFSESETGIFPVSFSLQSGNLIGIMGGSGVGKSTFLNLLNGNLKPVKGNVTINGYDVHREKDHLNGIIGYIPQDDLLIEELTVYQNLYYNARLCFSGLSEKQIEDKVNKVLTDLGLLKIKDLRVGNPLNKFISGGQRKRLNISLELIREPCLFFIDEPTSGLSSTDSEMVMDLLKEQSLKGKLVIANIHQPSSDIFKSFDQLMVFDEGGRMVYIGNPAEAIVYFKSHNQLINADNSECLTCGNINPEQVLQTVELKEVNAKGEYTEKRIKTPDEWYTFFRKKNEKKIFPAHIEKTGLPPILVKIPGRFEQFKVFFSRTLKTKLADRMYILINFLEAPALAVILAFFTKFSKSSPGIPEKYLFSENVNIPVFIFMSILVSLFLGMMVSAEEIIRDRKILARESFLNLSKFSYYNSKVVFLFFVSLVQTITFVAIGNYILGMKSMFLSFWLMLFSVSFFSNLVGLIISDNMKTVVSIYILIPLMLVPQILLGGAMVKFDKLNHDITSQKYVPFIGDLFASRWAYEALMVFQFKNNRYEKNLYHEDFDASNAAFKRDYLIPELQLLGDAAVRHKNLTRDNLMMIRDELKKITDSDKNIPEFNPDILNGSSFGETDNSELQTYLSGLKNYYNRLFLRSRTEKDKKLAELENSLGSKDELIKMRQENFNNSVSEILLNIHEKDKIIYDDHELVRKAEPVFHLPANKWGRAHFFAPEKRFGNFLIDTYWFNLSAIWLMNLILFGCLQGKLFTKAAKWAEKLEKIKKKL